MRKVSLITGVLVLALGSAASAQKPLKVNWSCTPPNPAQQIAVPDQANHAYVIEQVHCTASTGSEIGGIKQKDGTGVEFVEPNGANAKGHGIFVETLANGDKITYSYTLTGMMANGMMQSGSNAWTATSGTGKMKGITAKGTCTAKGKPDGSADFVCSGTYTLK